MEVPLSRKPRDRNLLLRKRRRDIGRVLCDSLIALDLKLPRLSSRLCKKLASLYEMYAHNSKGIARCRTTVEKIG